MNKLVAKLIEDPIKKYYGLVKKCAVCKKIRKTYPPINLNKGKCKDCWLKIISQAEFNEFLEYEKEVRNNQSRW